MRPYILAETNWKAIKETQFSVAILPWGATEAHNYHLPYATDVIESECIAAESARIAWEQGSKVIVLPAIPFGVNTGQADITLDININPSTQLILLTDIVETLNRQGIHKLVILNSHGGNDFKPILRELGLKFPKMYISLCNWFQNSEKKNYFDNVGDHADEMETSLLMYLRPDLVLPLSQAGDGAENKHKIAEFTQGWMWAERQWSKVTADTGIGDPKLATAEKGERYFKYITEKIGNVLVQLDKLNTENPYR
ncbi:amidase [Capnocytophaga stomatis]|uniref:creatininase family protein n=1 Tax=Capnocytophaga stomatis TaxID=1848904 RepID=UPI001950F301|nr:creatininase family protein [Capnocytophaga stomatis]GIJ97661.1 amidase [Capnocytophaga stomatis]